MNNLKNVAGNDVSLFLFRFELHGNGIDFVLNKAIAADMYQDVDEKIKPLAHACCVVCPNQRLAVAPFLELKKSKRSFRTREALYF
jgi:hypothetical protein